MPCQNLLTRGLNRLLWLGRIVLGSAWGLLGTFCQNRLSELTLAGIIGETDSPFVSVSVLGLLLVGATCNNNIVCGQPACWEAEVLSLVGIDCRNHLLFFLSLEINCRNAEKLLVGIDRRNCFLFFFSPSDGGLLFTSSFVSYCINVVLVMVVMKRNCSLSVGVLLVGDRWRSVVVAIVVLLKRKE